MVLAAAVNFAGTLLLYRAFAVGTLAVVSPVASGFAVVTGLLAFAAGERPPGLVVVGAGLLVVGVAAVAGGVGGGAARSPAGVPEALGAALCLGVYFWALAGLTPALGWVWPVVVTRAVQLSLALVALRAGRGRVPAEAGRRRRPLLGGAAGATGLAVAGAALLDTAALVAFNLGLGSAYTTVTTALASLYSAVAALLAWALLRERLAPSQWAGVGVILAGVLLVSL
jgi:drug/metabolite transporter (DMT)-like permease